MSHKTSYRGLIAALAKMPPIVLDGEELTGPYLSTVLAINPQTPEDEAARTPQLVSEFGRLASWAQRQKEMAEIRYRVWRSGLVHTLTTDMEAAREKGLVTQTAKGEDRLPSITAVETWSRTLPEYMGYQEVILAATDAWQTLHGAYEAARIRERSLYFALRNGGGTGRTQATATGSNYDPDDGAVEYDYPEHAAQESVTDSEEAVMAAPRTPLPAATGAPPPPPSSAPVPPPPPPPVPSQE